MKIGLIYPNKGPEEKQVHLGLAYIASYVLKEINNVEINVLDTGVSSEKEVEAFLNKKFDIIGITSTSRTYREAIELAKYYKNKNNNANIIFGGPHVSIMTGELMKEPTIDYGVYGEGELTFKELVEHLFKYRGHVDITGLKKISGLIFRDKGEVIVNPTRLLHKTLDELPFPAFHLFPMEKYLGNHSMMTSRGCPFSCSFCATTEIWGLRWRSRSAENVVKEMEFLITNFGRKPIDFQDACFNTNKKRVEEICDLLIERKLRIPWTVRGFRADIINESLAKKMRRAGCAFVALGIESANYDMLVRIGKKETPEEISTGVRILREAEIDVLGQFMIGNPGETLETVKESLMFAKEVCNYKAVFGTAVPFPKTDLWDYVIKHGRFLIEPDCTRFEEIYPRVIFDTEEFPEEDRIEAIKLAKEAGLLAGGDSGNMFRDRLKKLFVGAVFKFLPGYFSYHLYFLLRKFSH